MDLATPIADLFADAVAAAATLPADHPLHTALQAFTAVLDKHYAAAIDHHRPAARPTSAARRASFAEDLADAQAHTDPAIQAAALALGDALQQALMTTDSTVIAVDLERVRATTLTLRNIHSSARAIRLRDGEFAGDLTATEIKAGSHPPDHPPTTQLTNVSAGGNITLQYGDATDPQVFAALETHYLQGLYAECNELPLANDGPVDAVQRRQPRLQRVYVDLVTTAPVTPQVMRRRLVTHEIDLAALETKLFGLIKETEEAFVVADEHNTPRPIRMTGPNTVEHLRRHDPDYWLRSLGKLIGQQRDVAEQLQLDADLLEQLLAPLSILDILQSEHQFVLLGDPGSGKSTLTRRLAGILASSARHDLDPVEAGWLTALTGSFGRRLLPVRIVLSRWAQVLPETASGSAADLIAECVRLLGRTAQVEGLHDHVMGRLSEPTPTLLILLDGLDEVTDPQPRAIMLQAVQRFCREYTSVPLIITCRSRPWALWEAEGEALPLPTYTLDKLTPDAIQAFVERWHAELVYAGRYTTDAADAAQRRLLTAIADPLRQDLADMAGTPLLLTMMARVNYEHGLPDSRAALYEQYLRQLLWEWERTKLDERGQETSLQRLLRQPTPPVPANTLELALARLAFRVHDRGDEQDTVDIAEHELRAALETIHPGPADHAAAWAVNVLKLIHDRTGLLRSVDSHTLQFSHRTFQEYLAARHLAGGDTTTILETMRPKIDVDGWGEAVRLAFGYLIAVQSQYDTALALLEELLPDDPAAERYTESEWRRLLLLGEIYARLLGPQRARQAQQRKRADRLIRDIPDLLTQALQAPTLPARQRLTAGRYLADLAVVPAELDAFVTVPSWDFRIARYPVTNHQFGRFVDAGGYRDDRWWQDEQGRGYRDNQGWTAPRLWDDARFNWSTQPVVGVSWYEANAYCAWLTDRLRQQGEITAQEAVRLPTEAEWELVAGGGEGRAYPWGNDFAPAKANTKESDLNQPTPVHMYPAGATREGVWDLAGNVWEWSNDDDQWGKMLCGGAYYSEKSKVVVSSRLGDLPDYGFDGCGFRCVVVPISL